MEPPRAEAVRPGVVFFLPSSILLPQESIIFSQFKIGMPTYYLHPVLVISVNATAKTVKFLPLVVLRRQRLENARNSALVWPRLVLVDQSFKNDDEKEETMKDDAIKARNDDKNEEAKGRNGKPATGDEGIKPFETVPLAETSLRVPGQEFWISLTRAFKIETAYLEPYPPRNTQPRRLSLPNPPVYFDKKNLKKIIKLHKQHYAHLRCIESPKGIKLPEPKEGFVVQLPNKLPASSIVHSQLKSEYERILGHPFLITRLYGYVVQGFPLTSFDSQPIKSRYAFKDDDTKWIRAQYLIIEGTDSETHDGLPVIRLGKGSRQMRQATYIHVTKPYLIETEELWRWSHGGDEGAVFLAPGMVDFIEDYAKHHKQKTKKSGTPKDGEEEEEEVVNEADQRPLEDVLNFLGRLTSPFISETLPRTEGSPENEVHEATGSTVVSVRSSPPAGSKENVRRKDTMMRNMQTVDPARSPSTTETSNQPLENTNWLLQGLAMPGNRQYHSGLYMATTKGILVRDPERIWGKGGVLRARDMRSAVFNASQAATNVETPNKAPILVASSISDSTYGLGHTLNSGITKHSQRFRFLRPPREPPYPANSGGPEETGQLKSVTLNAAAPAFVPGGSLSAGAGDEKKDEAMIDDTLMEFMKRFEKYTKGRAEKAQGVKLARAKAPVKEDPLELLRKVAEKQLNKVEKAQGFEKYEAAYIPLLASPPTQVKTLALQDRADGFELLRSVCEKHTIKERSVEKVSEPKKTTTIVEKVPELEKPHAADISPPDTPWIEPKKSELQEGLGDWSDVLPAGWLSRKRKAKKMEILEDW